MAKQRKLKQAKQEPPQWGTNVRARVEVADILQPETEADKDVYAAMTKWYSMIGPEYTLQQVKEGIEGVSWQKKFEAYATMCGRIERLLIMMLQANAPLNVGTRITIRPDSPHAEDWDGYVTGFHTTMIEATKHVMLEVYLSHVDSYEANTQEFKQIGDIGM